MNGIKLISLVLAADIAALTVTSCGREIGQNDNITMTESQAVTEETEQVTTEDASEAVTTAAESEVPLSQTVYTEYSQTLQAEGGVLSGGAKIDSAREGYQGEGYVTGLTSDEDGWELSFELTESQYYNITLTVAADETVKDTLCIGNTAIGDFTAGGSGAFEDVTFENVYIEKGTATISVECSSGSADIDQVTITALENGGLSSNLENASLVNKNADYNTKALYSYICSSFGSSILTGQHDTVGTLTETGKIYSITGKYPAIRFGDLMPFTEDMIIGEHEIEYAEEWAEKGGIVSYMWHWTDPMGSGEYYSDKTDFDLSKAVTEEDIAELSLDEIKALQSEGKVSEECVAIVEDIDKISEKLAELQEAGIPVLWRPLHEASNGYFWWGRDAESYKWLWKLLYERQTNYHKLNNLIWVWSAQNASWYVGDDCCDILSADIYDKGNLSGQVNRLLFLYKISTNKPIAMSECGNFPSVYSIAEENAMWSYIGQWGGNFLLNDDGELNTEYNTRENLIEFYNNNLTVTLDELPDFSELAEQIKTEEEQAAQQQAEEESESGEVTSEETAQQD